MSAPKIFFTLSIAFGIISSLPLAAQISLTSNTKALSTCSGNASGGTGTINCTIYQRETLPTPQPAIVTIAETGTGSDTISVSETCSPNHFVCFNINYALCQAGVNPCSSSSTVGPGAGANSIELRLQNSEFYTIGTTAPFTTGTFTFTVTDQHGGSYTVVLTYNITARTNTTPVIVYPAGTPTGCSFNGAAAGYPTSVWDMPTECTNPTNYNPTGGATVAPPALGGTYMDGNFGATVHMVDPFVSSTSANSGSNNVNGSCDAFLSCMNSDGTLVLLGGFAPWTNQTEYVTYTHKSGKTGRLTATATTPGFLSWSAQHPYRYFTTNNTMTLYQIDINPSAPASCLNGWVEVTCGTTTAIYTDTTTNGTSMSAGGEGPAITKDEWLGFKVDTRPNQEQSKICVMNLNNVAQVYCAAYPSDWVGSGMAIRDIEISPGIDSGGFRYMLVTPFCLNGPCPDIAPNGAWVPMSLYRFDTSTLTLSYIGQVPLDHNSWPGQAKRADGPGPAPIQAYANISSGHLTMGEGCSGGNCKEFLVRGSNDYSMTAMTITAEDLSTYPNWEVAKWEQSQVTGGYWFFHIQTSHSGDVHISCAQKGGACAIATLQTTGSGSTPTNTVFTVGNMSGSGVTPVHVTQTNGESPNFDGSCTSVVFGGAMGNTVLDGKAWTISNYAAGPPASFDIAGATGNGTWVSGTGSFECNSTVSYDGGSGELFVIDLNYLVAHNGKGRVLRLARTLSMMPSHDHGNLISYFFQGHPDISADGTVAGWVTNFGIPEQANYVTVDTGWSGTPGSSTTVSGSVVVSGKTTIQ